MKHLIECIIKKWFCCHEWNLISEYHVKLSNDLGEYKTYTILHFFCKKCGKYKKIKSH